MLKQFVRYYWATVLMSIIIFVLSTIRFSSLPHVASFSNSDKIAHLVLYAILGFLVYWNFSQDKYMKLKFPNILYSIFAVLILFGGSIEIIQELFFKPRSAEFLDWLADIIGLVVGGFLAKSIFK